VPSGSVALAVKVAGAPARGNSGVTVKSAVAAWLPVPGLTSQARSDAFWSPSPICSIAPPASRRAVTRPSSSTYAMRAPVGE
jgi:hypothetical protein